MAESPPFSAAPTIFIRCATLHSRGELLNGFFFAHRDVLGLREWYETAPTPASDDTGNGEVNFTSAEENAAAGATSHTASFPRLPPHFPVEVLYMRNSRKPYFLVEWRYPTPEEEEKRKDTSDGISDGKGEVCEASEAKASSSEGRVAGELLQQLAERTLSLGRKELSGDVPTWKGQPVFVSAALPGMTVVAERRKLELRDAQLKIQRTAEKREREKADSAAPSTGMNQRHSAVMTPTFIPRCVRRRT
ncbi:hypothetical protein JKF63_01121 [Porcisia hertigi]|uniref:Uncharacterized protein n=1 Tax=Porcisia hertigi TaxID=2761500 RepID=A0A836I343_9TRYP|nr:hypothetical protein JKF63_01121 [Porcisia hertigi]